MTRRRALALLLLAATVALGPGCTKKPPDPEAEIAALIARVEAAVEAGDLGEIKETLADDYADPKGNDKAALVGMVQLQLLRRRSIHVISKIDRIIVQPDARSATAVVFAAAGATPIAGLDALGDVRADLFELTLTLARPDDDWLVRAVRWKRAGAGDFADDGESSGE